MPKKYHIKLNDRDVKLIYDLLAVSSGVRSKKLLNSMKAHSKAQCKELLKTKFEPVVKNIGRDSRRLIRHSAKRNAAKKKREAATLTPCFDQYTFSAAQQVIDIYKKDGWTVAYDPASSSNRITDPEGHTFQLGIQGTSDGRLSPDKLGQLFGKFYDSKTASSTKPSSSTKKGEKNGGK